ncbi:hypothetical protein AC579_7117 [Pseudocercospora musae]|uniref:Uncharacterized protein n=1 Tax=Pseudocercospora musae TaxID=113226 RepID=A0A139IN65_9PEZI|nr:hypothetical protein AC579_7117 [Pseudocercospora musae]
MGEFNKPLKSSKRLSEAQKLPNDTKRTASSGPDAPNHGNYGAQGDPTPPGNENHGGSKADNNGGDNGAYGDAGGGYGYGMAGNSRAGGNGWTGIGKPFSLGLSKKSKGNTGHDVITYSEHQVKAPHTQLLYITRPRRRIRDKLIAYIVKGRRTPWLSQRPPDAHLLHD